MSLGVIDGILAAVGLESEPVSEVVDVLPRNPVLDVVELVRRKAASYHQRSYELLDKARRETK